MNIGPICDCSSNASCIGIGNSSSAHQIVRLPNASPDAAITGWCKFCTSPDTAIIGFCTGWHSVISDFCKIITNSGSRTIQSSLHYQIPSFGIREKWALSLGETSTCSLAPFWCWLLSLNSTDFVMLMR